MVFEFVSLKGYIAKHSYDGEEEKNTVKPYGQVRISPLIYNFLRLKKSQERVFFSFTFNCLNC